MSETFHQRWMRLSRTRDYAGALALLRTPIPAENGADDRPSDSEEVRLSSTDELNPPPTGEGWRPTREEIARAALRATMFLPPNAALQVADAILALFPPAKGKP